MKKKGKKKHYVVYRKKTMGWKDGFAILVESYEHD